MNGDYVAAIEFAKRIGRGKIPPLAVIGENYIDLESFSDEKAAEAWLIKHNSSNRSNIYFQVNSLRIGTGAIKKASRDHIARMDFLHVDIDARAGEELSDELERIRRVVEGISPRPTAVILSGNGYQVFWRLREPFLINGQADLYEEAARYNIQLANDLGGDGCHNVDRIMRLPGTINWPNKVKRAKGRKPVLAELVEFNDVEFDLSDFRQAPLIQSSDRSFRGETKVSISSNIVRIGDVGELDRWEVPDFHKQLIVQGHEGIQNVYPDRMYPSSSEALWAVVCELVRCRVPDEVIYSIITDPDLLISTHILKQKRAEKYAISQIERAHEYAVDPDLAEMNERHAVISNLDGKCVVMSLGADESGEKESISFQAFSAFRDRYMNQYREVQVKDKVKSVPLGDWWLRQPDRRQYETIVFNPGRDVPGCFNMWRGFAVEPRPGNWGKFNRHLLENVCGGRLDLHSYLLDWMANTVQFPDQPGHTAVVLRGEPGAGKGFTVKMFGWIFGEHFTAVSNAKHVTGQFNGHLRHTVLLFGDEAFSAGDKQHESTLKTLVTEKFAMFERKGVDAKAGTNCLHIMLSSNENWVVPMGLKDRRFLVLDVNSSHRLDRAYFSELEAELKAGGFEGMLHELLARDVSGWDPGAIPSTDARSEQELYSLSGMEAWWYERLCAGSILPDHDWEDAHPAPSLLYEVSKEQRFATSIGLGLFLKKYAAPRKRRIQRPTLITFEDGHRGSTSDFTAYLFPSLEECRERWAQIRPGVPIVPVEPEEGYDAASHF